MKTALILGVNGNFGSQMALALKAQGYKIKALIRNKTKAPKWLDEEHLTIGDATDRSKVLSAASGVDLIVYALNPSYQRWHIEALPLLEPAVSVVEELGIRLLFPGNVYNFAPTESLIDEAHAKNPITDKGEIRVAMETRLLKASEQGAKVTIIRAGDFIGPNAHSTWLDMILKEKKGQVKISFPHDENHIHFWSYLPDLCANAAQLMEKPQAAFEVWHDTGLALSRADWQQAFDDNGQAVKFTNFAWWAFKLISPFVPLLKEVMKMKYLWEQPVILDGGKMKRALGDQYKATELTEVIKAMTSTSYSIDT